MKNRLDPAIATKSRAIIAEQERTTDKNGAANLSGPIRAFASQKAREADAAARETLTSKLHAPSDASGVIALFKTKGGRP